VADSVFMAAKARLTEHGWQPGGSSTQSAKAPGTIFSAMRRVCGIHPDAWLGVYVDWELTTATYSEVVALLQELVEERVGRKLNYCVWEDAADRTVADVLELLDEAARRRPDLEVPSPPVFRPGVDPKQKKTLKRPVTQKLADDEVSELQRLADEQEQSAR
jgi:hypothetical protein